MGMPSNRVCNGNDVLVWPLAICLAQLGRTWQLLVGDNIYLVETQANEFKGIWLGQWNVWRNVTYFATIFHFFWEDTEETLADSEIVQVVGCWGLSTPASIKGLRIPFEDCTVFFEGDEARSIPLHAQMKEFGRIIPTCKFLEHYNTTTEKNRSWKTSRAHQFQESRPQQCHWEDEVGEEGQISFFCPLYTLLFIVIGLVKF